MKYIAAICLIIILAGCTSKKNNTTTAVRPDFVLSSNSLLYAQLPLVLSDFNLKQTGIQSPISKQAIKKIEETVNNYYSENYGKGNNEYFKVRDTYLRTIIMQTPTDMIYLVLLKHLPGEELNYEVLIYNKASNSFSGPLDFNLFAMYDLDHEKLISSNLKTKFHITSPDVEFAGFDSGLVAKYRFTRLVHNGTYNAIETTVLKVNGTHVDTIEHKLNSLAN